MKKKISKLIVFISVFLLICSKVFAETDMGNLGQIDYIYLLRTNLVMLFILVLSLFSLAVIVEKIIYFKRIKFNSKKSMKTVEEYIKAGDYTSVAEFCKKSNPFNNTVKAILENRTRSKSDLEEIYEIVRSQEKESMEKRMVILGSSAAVAPLLGLLGTVTGIIKAFADLAAAGTGGPSVVAAGVSEALVTTAFGLIVAIPVLLFFNSFNSRVKLILEEIDINVRLLFFVLEKR